MLTYVGRFGRNEVDDRGGQKKKHILRPISLIHTYTIKRKLG